MTWKEAARRFCRRWRNVEHNYREALRELTSWHIQCQAARTHAARYSNQLSVVRTFVTKFRRRELTAKAVIVGIENMLRDNPEMHERET